MGEEKKVEENNSKSQPQFDFEKIKSTGFNFLHIINNNINAFIAYLNKNNFNLNINDFQENDNDGDNKGLMFITAKALQEKIQNQENLDRIIGLRNDFINNQKKGRANIFRRQRALSDKNNSGTVGYLPSKSTFEPVANTIGYANNKNRDGGDNGYNDESGERIENIFASRYRREANTTPVAEHENLPSPEDLLGKIGDAVSSGKDIGLPTPDPKAKPTPEPTDSSTPPNLSIDQYRNIMWQEEEKKKRELEQYHKALERFNFDKKKQPQKRNEEDQRVNIDAGVSENNNQIPKLNSDQLFKQVFTGKENPWAKLDSEDLKNLKEILSFIKNDGNFLKFINDKAPNQLYIKLSKILDKNNLGQINAYEKTFCDDLITQWQLYISYNQKINQINDNKTEILGVEKDGTITIEGRYTEEVEGGGRLGNLVEEQNKFLDLKPSFSIKGRQNLTDIKYIDQEIKNLEVNKEIFAPQYDGKESGLEDETRLKELDRRIEIAQNRWEKENKSSNNKEKKLITTNPLPIQGEGLDFDLDQIDRDNKLEKLTKTRERIIKNINDVLIPRIEKIKNTVAVAPLNIYGITTEINKEIENLESECKQFLKEINGIENTYEMNSRNLLFINKIRKIEEEINNDHSKQKDNTKYQDNEPVESETKTTLIQEKIKSFLNKELEHDPAMKKIFTREGSFAALISKFGNKKMKDVWGLKGKTEKEKKKEDIDKQIRLDNRKEIMERLNSENSSLKDKLKKYGIKFKILDVNENKIEEKDSDFVIQKRFLTGITIGVLGGALSAGSLTTIASLAASFGFNYDAQIDKYKKIAEEAGRKNITRGELTKALAMSAVITGASFGVGRGMKYLNSWISDHFGHHVTVTGTANNNFTSGIKDASQGWNNSPASSPSSVTTQSLTNGVASNASIPGNPSSLVSNLNQLGEYTIKSGDNLTNVIKNNIFNSDNGKSLFNFEGLSGNKLALAQNNIIENLRHAIKLNPNLANDLGIRPSEISSGRDWLFTGDKKIDLQKISKLITKTKIGDKNLLEHALNLAKK